MGRIISIALLLTFCSLVATPLLARNTQTGFLDRTVTVSGVTYRYQVFVPSNFDPHKKWPVILFLHGAGERGGDGLVQTDVGLGHAIRKYDGEFPFVVVMPQCRKEKVWNDSDMQAQALAALDQTMKDFKGDKGRVYLTGLSMGGYGTWDLAGRNLGRFAAFVPICGGIHGPPHFAQLHAGLVDDPKIADPYAETARRIGSTPVWIFHGSDDPLVPVEESRKMAKALQAAKANFHYTEYPGVGHESWNNAYAEPTLFPWLLEQRLKK
jgi:predicted peptidase